MPLLFCPCGLLLTLEQGFLFTRFSICREDLVELLRDSGSWDCWKLWIGRKQQEALQLLLIG